MYTWPQGGGGISISGVIEVIPEACGRTLKALSVSPYPTLSRHTTSKTTKEIFS